MAYGSSLLVAVQKITISLKASYNRRWLLLWLALVLLALPLTALAQGGTPLRPAPVILTDRQEKYPLGLHLELLADPTGQLTIADVSSPAYDDRFTPSQAAIPNPGSTTGAIWARFQVRNQAGPATAWRLAVAEARLAYVDLYLPAGDGAGWRHQQAGRSRPFTVREVPYRYGVFKLPLSPGQTQTVYLHFQIDEAALLPLTIWSLEAFSHHAQTELLILGLFYGAMLMMLGYSLFLFASLRDRSYLYLALFITNFGLNDAFREGLAQQYLWPAWPNLYGILITATLNYIIVLLFGASFLQTKVRTPWLHKLMMAVISMAILILILNYIGGWLYEAHSILALLTILLLVAAGYSSWRQGYRPARYFLLAWLLLLGAATFHNLTNAGLLPGTPFGQQSMRIGMVLMVLLLSLALADRINLLKAETAASERRLYQFLEAMPVGVAVYDAAARLSFINQQARRLLNVSDTPPAPDGSGLTLDQTIVHTSPYVAGSEQPYPPEQMPVRRALQGEAATVDDMEIRGPGQRTQLEVWASPIYDQQQGLQYAITAIQDITRRKLLELELRYHRDQLEEVVTERTRELTGFIDLTMLVGETRTQAEVLEVALDRIIELGKCQAVALHLPAEDQPDLVLVAQRGLSTTQQQIQRLPLEPPLSDWLARRQEPVLAFDLPTAANLSPLLWLDGFQVYLGAQLRAKEQIQGILSYYRASSQPFSMDEILLLAALAEQLGIIIENYRLRGHIEKIAVVAERQRLARDLHDSITQSLYSLNLFAHAVRQAAEVGDAERLANSLDRVEAIAQTALKEMRLLLYQLRPPVLAEKSLAEALQLRFDSVERRVGIDVDYQVEGAVDLPDETAEALYWAALETLNNSLKHAEASRVTVRLEMVAPTVTLKIVDNGRGFDPDRVSGGMGLRNIQERLEQLDGCLKISSAPGAGTTVEFAVSVADAPDNR